MVRSHAPLSARSDPVALVGKSESLFAVVWAVVRHYELGSE